VVARGGGSLADLFAFCDETLCRTVALLRVPVVASVGHHTDRTLIDDVAAVSCSTPTHAAEAAVPLHCTEARARVLEQARCLARHGRRAVPLRARTLALLARRPGEHLRRERERLARAVAAMDDAAARRVGAERTRVARRALVLQRQAAATAGARAAERRAGLDALAAALAAHDPARVLDRGYAMVEDGAGVVTSAQAARAAGAVRLTFADGAVDAEVQG
jgi:exodeoxyribonuclease VII large subunit